MFFLLLLLLLHTFRAHFCLGSVPFVLCDTKAYFITFDVREKSYFPMPCHWKNQLRWMHARLSAADKQCTHTHTCHTKSASILFASSNPLPHTHFMHRNPFHGVQLFYFCFISFFCEHVSSVLCLTPHRIGQHIFCAVDVISRQIYREQWLEAKNHFGKIVWLFYVWDVIFFILLRSPYPILSRLWLRKQFTALCDDFWQWALFHVLFRQQYNQHYTDNKHVVKIDKIHRSNYQVQSRWQ